MLLRPAGRTAVPARLEAGAVNPSHPETIAGEFTNTSAVKRRFLPVCESEQTPGLSTAGKTSHGFDSPVADALCSVVVATETEFVGGGGTNKQTTLATAS